jgi:heterotetrameric sarcosine oxidase delta subunit
MALLIDCPNCGSRPFTEFWFGGELGSPPPVPGAPTDAGAEFARVWLRGNVAGEQRERWFHYAGCRRWLTAQRDTRTNQMQGSHENGHAAG